MSSWIQRWQNSKSGTRSEFFTQEFARLALSVALVLSVSCAKPPRIEFHCPFPPRNGDVAQEELDGALDDAPLTFDWIGEVEHECGFIGD